MLSSSFYPPSEFSSRLKAHPQWPCASVIHKRLTSSGFQSLLAGGVVRDLLLGGTPKDIDIATNATPRQVAGLFDKTLSMGRAFGVMTVVEQGVGIEVATFRKDGEYRDGRRPESIHYAQSWEDAHRRDFTINALFYDPGENEILDYVGGLKDLEEKTIRVVGTPEIRFEEDKLRLLRALRFVAQLNFNLDLPSSQALTAHAPQISQVSMDRVGQEWEKLLQSPWAYRGIEKTQHLKLWPHLFPHWEALPQEVYQRIFSKGGTSFTGSNSFPWHGANLSLYLVWILWFLLHGEKEDLSHLGSYWRLPNKLIQALCFCQKGQSFLQDLPQTPALEGALFLNQKWGPLALSSYKILNKDQWAEGWEKKLVEIQAFFDVNGKLPSPLLVGKDLLALGFQPGPQLGEQLEKIYREQLLCKITDRTVLLKKITPPL